MLKKKKFNSFLFFFTHFIKLIKDKTTLSGRYVTLSDRYMQKKHKNLMVKYKKYQK